MLNIFLIIFHGLSAFSGYFWGKTSVTFEIDGVKLKTVQTLTEMRVVFVELFKNKCYFFFELF
jgi:hypothetical protein